MSLSSDDLAQIKQLLDDNQAKTKQMLSDALLDHTADMRQLMQAMLAAQMRDIDARFDAVDERFEEQDEKLNTIIDAVGIQFNEQSDQLDDHETRIGRLEKRAA